VVVTNEGLAQLVAAGVAFEVLVPDVDAVARAEHARLHDPHAAQPADWFAEYRDYRAITARIHELAELAPDRVSVHPLATTHEGRTLWALRIAGRSPNATPMLINGTQHAREWIAAMTTTCVADRLVRDYDSDPAIRAFVDSTELWVVPVVNPDGYQYSWASDRYWRKNRHGAHGVDLNRNYSVGWGGSGSSGSERSQVYRGEREFSEVESSALRDLAKREQIAMHVDFHSFGQLVMYPWMYTATPVKDRDRYAAIGDRMASAMFAQHETRYRLVSGVETSPTGGTMTDWMYGEAGALSYTVELRPRGGSGFVLPPEQIRPTCDEGLAAVLALRGAK
jgi:carboxypeptidase T